MKRTLIIIGIFLVILAGAGFAYWYFLFGNNQSQNPASPTTPEQPPQGFSPFNRPPTTTTGEELPPGTGASTTTLPQTSTPDVPILRLLSTAPVGGYGVISTATTTRIRWVDRGRGNIYEAITDMPSIATLSNTLVPRIYESWWNRDGSVFAAQYLSSDTDAVTAVTAQLIKNPPTPQGASSSPTHVSETPYQLKGKLISGDVIAIAPSPKRDRILIVTSDRNRAVGYISNFDGTRPTQIFDLPITQINVEWPEENTIAITTKGNSLYPGFLYFIDVRTKVMRHIMGNIPGLSTRVNADATKVFYSYTGRGNDRIASALFDVKSRTTNPVIFRTLADVCVWSPRFTEQLYCAVPSPIPTGTYPDDWYTGTASFIDTIWLYNAHTDQGRQIANLLDLGNTLIDAHNLQLGSNDEYLFFMNKRDLSLWSLDLVSTE